MIPEADHEQAAPAQQAPQSFEQKLKRLEEIVAQLEQGSATLDTSLALYEEGMGAYRACRTMLDEADTKVRKLVESLQGELKEEPFETPQED